MLVVCEQGQTPSPSEAMDPVLKRPDAVTGLENNTHMLPESNRNLCYFITIK